MPWNRPKRRARASLAWCLFAVVAFQALLDLAIDRWPEIRDPEFGFKLARLRDRQAAAPGQPLILLLGSSRSGVGLDPHAFQSALPKAAAQPVVFNYAMTGAGPIQQLMLLRELLDQRIQPHRLLIELHPLLLNQRLDATREETRIDVCRLSRLGMSVLCRYSQVPRQLRRNWWRWRLWPWHAYRHQLLDCWLPGWCVRPGQYAGYRRIGPWGWLPFPVADLSDDARRKRVQQAHDEYRAVLPAFDVTSEPDRALRELLDLCAQRRIAVTVFLMPEGNEFRSWYPPHAYPRLRDYLGGLQDAYGFDLHDLSVAMADECFADSHHLLPDAVASFSARFAHDVLSPSLPRSTTEKSGQYVAERTTTEGAESRR